MTLDEKIAKMQSMIGSDEEDTVLTDYLLTAKEKILNHRDPFSNQERPSEVEPKFEYAQIELAIVLYNQKGGEGQSTHSENGVKREWRTVEDILSSIPRTAGIPS